MIWEPATVASRTDLNEELFLLSLAVNSRVADGFHVAGQYHRVHVEGVGDSIFAMASPPGRVPFEYLVKRSGHQTEALGKLPVGAAVRVSHVMGAGFPLDLAKEHDLLLVGTGSAVGPLRAVIEAIRPRRDEFGAVTLLYGARTPSHLAFADDFERWARERIAVVPTLTRPGREWTGLTGRVQGHLGGLTLKQALVFACGQKQMLHELGVALEALGVPAHHVFHNH